MLSITHTYPSFGWPAGRTLSYDRSGLSMADAITTRDPFQPGGMRDLACGALRTLPEVAEILREVWSEEAVLPCVVDGSVL